MKIMYVDISTDGHHLIYLNSLLRAASQESFAVVSECAGEVQGRCRKIATPAIRSLSGYRKWMRELKNIASEEQPKVVHFLDGDSIMRYFGMGLGQFTHSKIVITFHHLFPGKLREISMKKMLKQADAGVFHTETIAEKVGSFGCKNAVCISYPCFLNSPIQSEQGYQNKPPILLALGGTRYDKGLDILLDALKSVTQPFRLIVAGKEETFDRAYIEKQTDSYHDQVELKLHFLSEEEVLECLQRSDIIVLPYRKVFDGASGPMCEGIYLGKTIVGPGHGSLGRLIKEYHVGYTFESENVKALSECLDKALKEPFLYDEVAKKQQRELNPEMFQKRYQELYQRI
ncbi:MAG: glycosyltransferase family 4 protein [Lachnospiraceae bacterium]|nr:glycosyltransferase family 4 protein [Lachnospiraceae bacterium]